MISKDLRIGNLVLYKNRGIIRINSISEYDGFNSPVCDYDGHWDFVKYKAKKADISGIPLTEEWLIKFGFEFANESDYYKNYKNEIGIYISQSKKVIDNDPYGTISGKFYIGDNHVEIGSVHFLQNFIYFNYNRHELQIKQND